MISEPVAAPPIGEAAVIPQVSGTLPASQTVPVLAVPMHWSQAIKPCALAALAASLLMSLGLYPFVAMLVVGFLAVIFYRQGHPGALINAVAGARLGALSGLLWFAISSILAAADVLLLHKGSDVRQSLVTLIDQAASRTSDPETLAMLQRFKSPEGIELLMIVGLIAAFFAAIVLGALGGALGGRVLGSRKKD